MENPNDHCLNQIVKLETGLKPSSPYYYGYQIMDRFADVIKEYHFDTLFLVTSPVINDLYGRDFIKYFQAQSLPFKVIMIPEGERKKNFVTLSQLCEDLVANEVSKDSIILAFGGGVIGNIAGLAAALIYRGIRFVEIPTTIMGQTDSTLSNKQAINGQRGKNHFGVYHAPLLIWSDSAFLRSESPQYTKSGFVEAVKNGFISDPDFLRYLEEVLNEDLVFSNEQFHQLIYRIILSKIKIIQQDSSEKSFGIVLEYGHTFGHAIEWLVKGSLSHGESVAIGMCLAAELAFKLELLSREIVDRHYYVLGKKAGVNVALPPTINTESLMEAIVSDNKRTAKGVRYILLEDIGRPSNAEGDYMVSVDANVVKDTINEFIKKNAILNQEVMNASQYKYGTNTARYTE